MEISSGWSNWLKPSGNEIRWVCEMRWWTRLCSCRSNKTETLPIICTSSSPPSSSVVDRQICILWALPTTVHCPIHSNQIPRCVNFMCFFPYHYHEIRLWRGLGPRSSWRSLKLSPNPLAGYKKGERKVRGKGGEGTEGQGVEGRRGREGWDGMFYCLLDPYTGPRYDHVCTLYNMVCVTCLLPDSHIKRRSTTRC